MDDLDLLLNADISRAAEDAASPPDFATLAQRGTRRRRRRTLIVLVAGVAAVLAIVGSLQLLTQSRAIPAVRPSTVVMTTTPTQTTSPQLDLGPITSAQQYLDAADASDYLWRSFDAAADKGLFVCCDGSLRRVSVVGPDGPLATLTCARQLHCSRDDRLSFAAGLGPGTDEVTVESGDRTVQVLAYDGRVRRALSLDAVLPPAQVIRRLAWSPDGSRVAVVTEPPGDGFERDVWLFDSRGAGRLAYSGKIWALGGWSPDGQSLLVDVYVGQTGADVVRLDLQPGGRNTVTARTLYRSNRHFDWAGNLAWSPDGTRVAVRTGGDIVEISAEDGTELVRHSYIYGWLIWPRHER